MRNTHADDAAVHIRGVDNTVSEQGNSPSAVQDFSGDSPGSMRLNYSASEMDLDSRGASTSGERP
jgi:hypothetical protein